MLNEERVILMTKMASYEENEGKKNVRIGKYFRGDYISIQVLKAVFCATIAYVIVFGLYILYDFETFMQDLYKMDLLLFAKDVLFYYVVTVVSYSIIAYAVFSYRYTKAKKSLKCYYQNLKKLNSMYNEQQ